jgi:hypothetical protein
VFRAAATAGERKLDGHPIRVSNTPGTVRNWPDPMNSSRVVHSSATRTGFESAPIIDNPWAAPNRCAASRTFESNPLMRIRVLLFGEFLDLWTWVGALIIVVSGSYMIYGEKRGGHP